MSKRKPGYVALVLNDETRERLSKIAMHPNVQCKHVMIAFRPTPEVYAKYTGLLGKQMEFDMSAIVWDDAGQVVKVVGVPSENKYPHVTVSLAEGVKPAYSNELLASTEGTWHSMARGVARGRGKVEFVSYF